MKMDAKPLVRLSTLLLCLVSVSPVLAQSVANILPNIKTEALAVHNKWRTLHQAPKLSWDPELQHYAELYASLCVFKHSNPPFGENLAAGYVSVTAAVNAWYAEGVIL